MFRLITDPGSRWLFWVCIVWCIIVFIHFLKVFVFKGKLLGKEPKGEEEILKNESKVK